MGDSYFSEKVNKKLELERKLIDESKNNLYNTVSGSAGSKKNYSASEPFLGSLYAVMDYLKVERITFPDNISDEAALKKVMSETGIMGRDVTLSGKWWKDVTLPLLVYHKEKDINIILIPDGKKYVYYDNKGRHILNAAEAGKINKNARCMYRPFKNDSISIKEFLINMLGILSKADFIWLISISILVSLLGLITPMINKYIFNNIVPSGTSKELLGIGILLVGATLVSALISLFRNIWIMRIGTKIEIFGQNAIYARLLNLPVDFFKRYDSGELTMRVEAINKVCRILGGELISSVLGAVFSVVYLFQIAGIAPSLLPASIVIIMIMVSYMFVDTYCQLKYMQRCNEADNRLSGFTYQLFNGITKIKIAGAEVRAYAKWSELYEKYPLIPGVMTRISGMANSFIYYAGIIVMYCIVVKASISTSDFIAFNTSFSLFCGAVMMLGSVTRQMASLKPSLDMLRPIIEEKPENDGDKTQVKKLDGNIEVSQVYFRYNEDMPYVLNGINLDIKKGEYIGIVGSSGCGKSTLFRILLGFEKPESGSVYYDMQDLSGLDMRSVRQRIGVVLQNGKLFSGDIYSNIVVGAPWLTVDDAWEAAEACGLADDIESFPMGMYTMLSEGGGGLSGGQQQRLLIARALAPKPDILMFDEATSALDNITQAQVVKTLEELDCTRIVIAHRLSTIRKCSRIVYLDAGAVVEEGTYEELMELNGRFAAMAKRQLV